MAEQTEEQPAESPAPDWTPPPAPATNDPGTQEPPAQPPISMRDALLAHHHQVLSDILTRQEELERLQKQRLVVEAKLSVAPQS